MHNAVYLYYILNLYINFPSKLYLKAAHVGTHAHTEVKSNIYSHLNDLLRKYEFIYIYVRSADGLVDETPELTLPGAEKKGEQTHY